MNPLKIARLIGSFYKSFSFFSLLMTACCVILFWEYHFNIFAILFWLKVATGGITFIYINGYKSNEYYYYQNLGVSKTKLWSGSLIFDFSIFILLIYITSKLW